MEPAQQVGGDLFDVLRLGHDRVLVAVGDVSGKGIPAALFMAVTMTLLRSMARVGQTLDEILRHMNDELLQQNPRGMFVTLQVLLFDLAAGRVTCASVPAAHAGSADERENDSIPTGLAMLAASVVTTRLFGE